MSDFSVSTSGDSWDMVGTIAKALGNNNPSQEERKQVSDIINRQMLFMTKQTFGYFFTQGKWQHEVLPSTEILESIKHIYGFDSID